MDKNDTPSIVCWSLSTVNKVWRRLEINTGTGQPYDRSAHSPVDAQVLAKWHAAATSSDQGPARPRTLDRANGENATLDAEAKRHRAILVPSALGGLA